MTAPGFTHLDAAGRARMVDVSDKTPTRRAAVAEGRVAMAPATLALIEAGGAPKGDVLAVARVAGILAAKRTAELIPLCHPLPLAHVSVDFARDPDDAGVLVVTASAATDARTGVEMEALTAVAVAALTLYDMVKAVDRAVVIERVRLLEKSGGRSGGGSGGSAQP